MTSKHFSLSIAQKSILAIIIIAVVAVIAFTIFAFNTHTSIDIESEISKMSSEYYEQYYFPDLENSIRTHSDSSVEDALSEYTATGLSRVPLRQIIAHTQSDPTIVQYISTRCDVNNTLVHFFPESPFTATSYHTSYTYSCNF